VENCWRFGGVEGGESVPQVHETDNGNSGFGEVWFEWWGFDDHEGGSVGFMAWFWFWFVRAFRGSFGWFVVVVSLLFFFWWDEWFFVCG
jgi:hypothetical protein